MMFQIHVLPGLKLAMQTLLMINYVIKIIYLVSDFHIYQSIKIVSSKIKKSDLIKKRLKPKPSGAWGRSLWSESIRNQGYKRSLRNQGYNFCVASTTPKLLRIFQEIATFESNNFFDKVDKHFYFILDTVRKEKKVVSFEGGKGPTYRLLGKSPDKKKSKLHLQSCMCR